MKKIYLFLIIFLFIFNGCIKDSDESKNEDTIVEESKIQNSFPIGVWLQSPTRERNGVKNVEQYKNIGVNTFIGLWKWPNESWAYSGYNLKTAQSLKDYGMKVYAGNDITAVDWIKGHPEFSDTFIGYVLGDEPDMFKVNYNPITAPQWEWTLPNVWKSAGEALHVADPSREIYANFGKPFSKNGSYTPVSGSTRELDFAKYVSPTTLLSSDFYGITDPYEALNNHGIWTYGRAVKITSSYSEGRPVWGFLEVSAPWKTTNTTNQMFERMQPKLVKPIIWNMLLNGADGIVYFCHDFLTGGSDGCLGEEGMADAMTDANNSIKKYETILQTTDISGVTATVTGKVDLLILTKKYEDNIYIFAMGNGNADNIYGSDISAEINFAEVSNKTVEVLEENRSLKAINGIFSDIFKPYELHIYKVSNK